MTAADRPLPPLSANVGRNVRALRLARRWSVRQLADECQKIGAAQLTVGSLTNLDRGIDGNAKRGPREVSVDDLQFLATIFEIGDPWQLTHAPTCELCNGAPPVGFTCNACGERSANVDR